MFFDEKHHAEWHCDELRERYADHGPEGLALKASLVRDVFQALEILREAGLSGTTLAEVARFYADNERRKRNLRRTARSENRGHIVKFPPRPD